MLVLLLLILAFLGVSSAGSGEGAAVEASKPSSAREFDAYPLYWLGERFERWELAHVDLDNQSEFVTFIYGTCTPPPEEEGGCPRPLQIQVAPLCAHLGAVARAPIWKHRQVRGAPVGTIDSAPVLCTRGAQVKVYRGQGSDAGLPWRALAALRSANRVSPVFGPGDAIPAPPPGLLAGTRPCAA
jgi:hypothetical protein